MDTLPLPISAAPRHLLQLPTEVRYRIYQFAFDNAEFGVCKQKDSQGLESYTVGRISNRAQRHLSSAARRSRAISCPLLVGWAWYGVYNHV